jgi:putative membrane protein
MMHYGYYGFMAGFGLLWSILFWALLIWLIVWLVRRGGAMHSTEGAVEILKERYAKGEITKKQYDDMKKDLG